MGKTSIEWTDASWNPIVGCTEISPGCANCYAARLAATRLKNTPQYKDLAVLHKKGQMVVCEHRTHWTGEVRVLDSNRFNEPQHWRKPRRIFVCDMGDLFHESVPDSEIKRVWFAMSYAPQHTYQILTKRAARMHQWVRHYYELHGIPPNVWLGVSVENQHFADERIPLLLATPAAVRWISAEPLLGPVNLLRGPYFLAPLGNPDHKAIYGPSLDWVVCGGESGANARPMHPDWARLLRDQCQAAGVPFFFKQWGSWFPELQHMPGIHLGVRLNKSCECSGHTMYRIPKKKAGRLLDGREWNQFPQVKP